MKTGNNSCLLVGIGGPGINITDHICRQILASESFQTPFTTTLNSGRAIPNALFFDNHDDPIDYLLANQQTSGIYPSNYFIKGTSNVHCKDFAASRYLAKEAVKTFLEKIRQFLEKEGKIESLILSLSTIGAAGGLASAVLEELFKKYPKINYHCLNLTSSPVHQVSSFEHYNNVLFYPNYEHLNSMTIFDNYQILNIAKNQLGIQKPTYEHVNEIIAQYFTTFAAPNIDNQVGSLNDSLQGLCPNSMMKTVVPSYAPFNQTDSYNIVDPVNDPKSFLVSCSNVEESISRAFYSFRGGVDKGKVEDAVEGSSKNFTKGAKKRVAVTPIKLTENNITKTTHTTQDVAAGFNGKFIGDIMKTQGEKYKKLYSMRAYVHWYVGNGMEEGEFQYAYEKSFAKVQDAYTQYSE